MEIPKHYDVDEVHDFLCRKAPFDTTEAFSAWLTVEFQKAFNKGWQKSASQQASGADRAKKCDICNDQDSIDCFCFDCATSL